MTTPLKVIFAGTPDFAAQHLAALINSKHDVIAVYCPPDKPSGRGKKLTACTTKLLALEHNIIVEQPVNFKSEAAQQQLAQYDAETVRFFLTTGHYRSQLNYSVDNLTQARASVERIYTSLRDVTIPSDYVLDRESSVVKQFCQAMDDDFNTPQALAVLFELSKELNVAKADNNEALASDLASTLVALGEVIGLLQLDPAAFLQGDNDNDEVAIIEALIVQRNQARSDKDWALADDARDKLNAMNVILEDSAGKTTWRKA